MKRLALAVVLLIAVAGCGWFGGGLQSVGPPSPTVPAHARGCAFSIGGTRVFPTAVTNGGLLAAGMPDGSLVVGSSVRHGSTVTVSLRRVTPDCQAHGMPTIRFHSGQFGAIDAIAATPAEQILLAGSDGHQAIVGRLLPTGELDPSFGQRGWTRLSPRERAVKGMPPPAYVATSIAVGSQGSIFVGGNDGGAHCCVQDFVGKLTSLGAPAFIDVLPQLGGSYWTQLSVDSGGVYALGEYEQSGCGGPAVVRIRPDGSLDTRFDTTMRKTLQNLFRARILRFTPSLVGRGGGKFALIGGFDLTCTAAENARSASSGIAVGIKPSGRLASSYGRGGATHFSSPNYAFDTPVLLPLASGRVLAAAVAYTPNYRPKSVVLQAFELDGSIDTNFGNAGRVSFPLQAHPRAQTASATLVPGPNLNAWLVIGLPNELDIDQVTVP